MRVEGEWKKRKEEEWGWKGEGIRVEGEWKKRKMGEK